MVIDKYILRAIDKLNELYDKEYLRGRLCIYNTEEEMEKASMQKREKEPACICRADLGDCVCVSFLFEDDDDRPDLKPDPKGWTVYATLDVDKETFEVSIEECVLQDGTVVPPNSKLGKRVY